MNMTYLHLHYVLRLEPGTAWLRFVCGCEAVAVQDRGERWHVGAMSLCPWHNGRLED